MDTKFTDSLLLFSFGIAAIQDHAGLFLTVCGGFFVGIIRWQQHRQTMKNLRLDEELKRRQLKD